MKKNAVKNTVSEVASKLPTINVKMVAKKSYTCRKISIDCTIVERAKFCMYDDDDEFKRYLVRRNS